MWGRPWNPVGQSTRAEGGATPSQTQETRTPRRDRGLGDLSNLTVADVPRLLRGLALLATGLETVFLPGRAVGDTPPPRPPPPARAPGRLGGAWPRCETPSPHWRHPSHRRLPQRRPEYGRCKRRPGRP